MTDCYTCGFFDDDIGCFCPSYDMWYACPIENSKPENIKALKEYAEEYADLSNKSESEVF